MSELVCVHRWTEQNPFVRHNGDDTPLPAWFRRCVRCDATQYDNEPEPRVVLARIE